MNNLSNRVIKGYELQEQVGAGGFGAVYRAYQPSVGREVAVKVILPEHANQPDFIRRFEVEAQLIARLEHPHIVPMYDYWRDPDGAFLVMRWLPSSLRRSMVRGAWPADAAARLLEQIAGALTIAHREGVIHRDIKPDNILLDEDGNAYLADFGIAKNLNTESIGDITAEGSVVGSPAYITPEQIRGEVVTPRTDIYSLGIVIYEVLTNEKPYAGSLTPFELINFHLNTPLPPLNSRIPTLSAALNEVLLTATAKDPAQRYANAMRFASAFRAALPNLQRAAAQPLIDPLTEREMDILRLMVEGLSNTEIAQKLYLSAGTVKWYVQQIYSKLDVHSRRHAIERAQQLKLVGTTVGNAAQSSLVPANQDHNYMPPTFVGQADVLELTNPYKGLRAFQESDAADFFGRAALTEQLLTRLAESGNGARFLVIVGPSGSGKSSVVRAGLLPALRRGGLLNSDRWFITEMLPGTHPLEELEAALLRVATSPQSGLLSQLSEDRRGLVRAVKRILPTEQDIELVLVIDQFEELFTLTTDETVRTHLIDNLLSAVTDPRSRIRLVLTLRADFYDKPLLYPHLAELVRSHTDVVVPLNSDELERAVAGPAERVGLSLEPGLVATILNDVGDQPGILPLLQYALTELYEQRQGTKLTLAAYRESGGMRGALARRADELYEELEIPVQAAARQLFMRLVTLGEGTEDTRRRVLRAELDSMFASASDDVSSRSLDEVINAYSQYRLLTLDRDPLTRGPTVEVAHEALLRTWTRLRGWLDDSREELHIQRRLLVAASEWNAAKRDASFLASGARLTQFEALAAGDKIALNADERAYLQASVTEREHTEQEEQTRQARELELAQQATQSAQQAAANAQQAADNAQRAAKSQRAAANRLRYLAAGLVLFLIVAFGLSVAAFNGRNDALAQRQNALDNAATSVANANVAEQQRLASQANVLLPGNTLNAELAALLAIRSLQKGYSPQADTALQQADSLLYTQKILHQTALDIAYSPNGKSLLIAAGDVVLIRDVATGAVVRTFTAPDETFFVCKFAPDGSRVFAMADNGYLFIWDTATGNLTKRMQTTSINGFRSWPFTLDISSDGKLLLFGGVTDQDRSYDAASEYDLWNLSEDRQVKQWRFDANLSKGSVALSPDGRYAAVPTNSTITLWSINSGAVQSTFESSIKSPYNGAAFSPDSRFLLTYNRKGDIEVWDVASAKLLRIRSGQNHELFTISFSPDNRYALISQIDGSLVVWDFVSGADMRRLTGHRNQVWRAVYSPDGDRIASLANSEDIRIWDANFTRSNGLLLKLPTAFNSLDMSSDGQRLLVSTLDRVARMYTTYLWQVTPFQQVQIFTNVYSGSEFARSGVFALITPRDAKGQTISLVDSKTAQTLKTINYSNSSAVNTAGSLHLSLSPNGKRLAVVNDDEQRIDIFDTETDQIVRVIKELPAKVTYGIFSPDSKSLFLGFLEGTAGAWSVETGTQMSSYTPPILGVPINSIGFSPDGSQVLVNSSEVTALYEYVTGKLLNTFSRDVRPLYGAVFSPDGKFVIVPAQNAPLTIYDVKSGQAVRQYISDSIKAYVALSPDGKVIYTAGNDGALRRWDFDFASLIETSCDHIFADFLPGDYTTYQLNSIAPTCPKLIPPLPSWRAVQGSWYQAQVPDGWSGQTTAAYVYYYGNGDNSMRQAIDFAKTPNLGTLHDYLASRPKDDTFWRDVKSTETTTVINKVTWDIAKLIWPDDTRTIKVGVQKNGQTYRLSFECGSLSMEQCYQQGLLPFLERMTLQIPDTTPTPMVTATAAVPATAAPTVTTN